MNAKSFPAHLLRLNWSLLGETSCFSGKADEIIPNLPIFWEMRLAVDGGCAYCRVWPQKVLIWSQMSKKKSNGDDHMGMNRQEGGPFNVAELCLELINRANDGIAVAQDGIIEFHNEQLAQMLGVTPGKLKGSPIEAYLHPEYSERMVEYHRKRAVGAEAPSRYEAALLHSDGSRVDVEMNAGQIEFHGRPASFVFIRDITARKKAENALRSSERMSRALLNAPTDAIVLLSRESVLLKANETAALRIGRPMKDMIGKRSYDLMPPGIARKRLEAVQEVVRTGKPLRFLDERDGVWNDNVVYPILDDEGEVDKIAFVARDVTEIKKTEAKLLKATEQLRSEQHSLTEKNIALRQVLEHIEGERSAYKRDVCMELENRLRPFFGRLKEIMPASGLKDFELLENEIASLLDTDMGGFMALLTTLSTRELEIAQLIRSGLSSKQICEKLHLSVATVHKHREQIRKKLGLTHQDVNLNSYLRTH